MHRSLILLGLLAALSACSGGQPFFPDQDGDGIPDDRDSDADGDGIPDDEAPAEDDGGDGEGDDGDEGGIEGDPQLPPGTANPQAVGGIFRYEADDGKGGGYVQDVSYDRQSDTFTVDNLAFDGNNVYSRSDVRPTLSTGDSLARYAVYEAREVVRDPDSNQQVGQFEYRAIYGVSANRAENGEPVTQFAIVRTGSYRDYGFGGFIYERNGGVDLPNKGQATYAGEYAGMRVFDGRGDLEYTRGDVLIDIDFEDFNAGSGVKGLVFNREAFDIDGNPISLGRAEGQLQLPELVFDVGPGTVTQNGEISSTLSSTIIENNEEVDYESGTYYAIVAGDKADEIVGIFVVESDDPRYDGVTAQETGGFIVYR